MSQEREKFNYDSQQQKNTFIRDSPLYDFFAPFSQEVFVCVHFR